MVKVISYKWKKLHNTYYTFSLKKMHIIIEFKFE